MSSNKINNYQQFPKKPTKNMEINMSTLSTAQKQMCLKLLAQTDINFEQAKDQNCFEAQLRIDPNKLTSEFCEQKETQPKVSPIKKRNRGIKPVDSKQNIQIASNRKIKEQKVKSKSNIVKATVHAIYTNSKKSLGKTVKLNNCRQLQILHPFVELYVYPKKMSFQNLIELIEEIYDIYWNCQIHGRTDRRKQTKLDRVESRQPFKNIKSNHKIKSLTTPTEMNEQKTKSFCQWVYENFVTVQKEKLKAEQLLVNLIESLNHFSFKHIGIQIFQNFLWGIYSSDTLNYFLVIRALLEQIEGEKIIQKVSNYGSKAGVIYKMKLNPYEKFIQQGKVLDFLDVCFQSTKSNSQQNQAVDLVFQEMTEQMFFDEKKRKNFIHFFEMVDVLLKQFLKIETVSTTNLQLSLTQQNFSMNDFLFKSQLQSMLSPNKQQKDQNIDLTFEVHQVEENSQIGQGNSEDDLNVYLPINQLETNPSKEQQKVDYQEVLRNQILKKFQRICRQFSNFDEITLQRSGSKQILSILIESVAKGDKKKWIDFIRTKKVNAQRESYELHFVEKLQKQYEELKSSNIVSNGFIKKILTASYLRQAIVIQATKK